ncbi:MAG: hypothetical protein F6J90_25825 [Moorea sp. SIOASIH]|uniref:hypothetical protein n=1 Tax=Moorena sp. SIOASIH TaxID=2607817 RepID=UPI0013BAFA6E|nr:hypothetical protein [Moorena sp. SIOASIH]NEO39565.1 hypothetical protein [Moorena sp. SIOASIH]
MPIALLTVPCSLFPVPYSLFPIPCSLFPVPCSIKNHNYVLKQLPNRYGNQSSSKAWVRSISASGGSVNS